MIIVIVYSTYTMCGKQNILPCFHAHPSFVVLLLIEDVSFLVHSWRQMGFAVLGLENNGLV